MRWGEPEGAPTSVKFTRLDQGRDRHFCEFLGIPECALGECNSDLDIEFSRLFSQFVGFMLIRDSGKSTEMDFARGYMGGNGASGVFSPVRVWGRQRFRGVCTRVAGILPGWVVGLGICSVSVGEAFERIRSLHCHGAT